MQRRDDLGAFVLTEVGGERVADAVAIGRRDREAALPRGVDRLVAQDESFRTVAKLYDRTTHSIETTESASKVVAGIGL